MIEAVRARIEKNAAGIFTPEEIEAFEEPEKINEYVAETPAGLVVATRTQHRIGHDGSGGGFKIIGASGGETPEELRKLSREQSLGLATLMTFKGDLVHIKDLPGHYGEDFGGAKGVMYVPESLLKNRDAMDGILRNYVATQMGKNALGLGIDRHAPDMNSGPDDMDVMAKMAVDLTGDLRAEAAFSGKTVLHEDVEGRLGGLEGREIATGLGMVFTLENHLETLGMNPKETTVAVQGSGNVGYHFARLATERLGVKIVGMSDKDKAVMGTADEPLRIDDTVTFSDRAINGWNDAHVVSSDPDDLYDMPVDVFVFAAAPDAITEKKGNVDRLKVKKLIIPGANNPMSEKAVDYYLEKGVSVVADVLCNAGGFVASNFEYNQGMTRERWTEKMAIGALKKVMDDAYKNVHAEAKDDINMVDPAFKFALKHRYEREHSGLHAAA